MNIGTQIKPRFELLSKLSPLAANSSVAANIVKIQFEIQFLVELFKKLICLRTRPNIFVISFQRKLFVLNVLSRNWEIYGRTKRTITRIAYSATAIGSYNLLKVFRSIFFYLTKNADEILAYLKSVSVLISMHGKISFPHVI